MSRNRFWSNVTSGVWTYNGIACSHYALNGRYVFPNLIYVAWVFAAMISFAVAVKSFRDGFDN